MNDPIFFFGGVAFLVLGFLSLFDRDRLWRFYQRDRHWRERNPERTEAWERKAQRLGLVYLAIGVVGVIAGF